MDSEERIVRLAKPMKKGLLRLVFSRFCVIALLLVFQILVLIAVYGYFADKLPILISLLRLFSLVMVIYLFNCDMDFSAKLTWMFVISILPLPGAAFLFFTQSNIGHRMETKLVDQQIQESKKYLRQTADVLAGIEADFQDTLRKCRAVTPESIKNEKTTVKLIGRLLKFISPLM